MNHNPQNEGGLKKGLIILSAYTILLSHFGVYNSYCLMGFQQMKPVPLKIQAVLFKKNIVLR